VKLLPGLDTRAAGGYVAAPPSVHPSGRRYRWIVPPGEAELAQAPEWLVALLEPVELPEPAPPPRPARTATSRATPRRPSTRRASGWRRPRSGAVRHARARGVRARPAGRGRVLPRAEAKAELVAAGLRMRSATGPEQARQALQALDQARGRVARRPGAGRRRGQAPDPGGPAMTRTRPTSSTSSPRRTRRPPSGCARPRPPPRGTAPASPPSGPTTSRSGSTGAAWSTGCCRPPA
jgi:hypothetical protein